MQVSQTTTTLVALGSLASLASTVVSPVHIAPAPAKAKASKPAKTTSPRHAVTLALDAMHAAFEKWTKEELNACAETLDAWSFGEIEDEDIDLQEIETWRYEVAKRGQLAFVTFMEEEPETPAAYIKASDEYKAYREAKKAGGVR